MDEKHARMLADLDERRDELNESFEKGFVENLINWKGAPSPGQINTIEGLYRRIVLGNKRPQETFKEGRIKAVRSENGWQIHVGEYVLPSEMTYKGAEMIVLWLRQNEEALKELYGAKKLPF